MKTRTAIWIKTSFIGYHHWPSAPQSVDYLRTLHRHLFGVRVRVEVTHSDRDIEFHSLKKVVDEVIRTDLMVNLLNTPSMSCEMMAHHIAHCLFINHEVRCSAVQVDEDGECGAEVYFQ